MLRLITVVVLAGCVPPPSGGGDGRHDASVSRSCDASTCAEDGSVAADREEFGPNEVRIRVAPERLLVVDENDRIQSVAVWSEGQHEAELYGFDIFMDDGSSNDVWRIEFLDWQFEPIGPGARNFSVHHAKPIEGQHQDAHLHLYFAGVEHEVRAVPPEFSIPLRVDPTATPP